MKLLTRPESTDFGWFRKELDRLTGQLRPFEESELSGKTAEWAPAVDIMEDDNAITIKVDLPEVEKKDIDVSVDNGTLTIKGERKLEQEEKKKNYHRIERSYGSYFRSFDLPDYVDANKIEAKSKDGVLRVTLPKNPNAKRLPAKIDVK